MAEPLESRRLLSAAPAQPMFSVALPVSGLLGPAAVAPFVTIPQTTGLASPIHVELGFGSNATTVPAVGFTETILVIEISDTGGFGVGPIQGVTAPTIGGATGGTTFGPVSTGGSVSAIGPASTSATGPAVGSSGQTGSYAPLTPTVLAGNTAVNRAVVAVIAVPQPLVYFGSSTIAPVTQMVLNTATLEEQPLPPPMLGQGFEAPVGQGPVDAATTANPRGSLVARRVDAEPPATDIIEPFAPEVGEGQVPVEPVRPAEPPAPPTPAPLPDAAPMDRLQVEPQGATERDQAPEIPVESPRMETDVPSETPIFSMAALVGTAAVVSGGYRLTLGGSSRLNQRWLPRRRSSKSSRGRKSGAV